MCWRQAAGWRLPDWGRLLLDSEAGCGRERASEEGVSTLALQICYSFDYLDHLLKRQETPPSCIEGSSGLFLPLLTPGHRALPSALAFFSFLFSFKGWCDCCPLERSSSSVPCAFKQLGAHLPSPYFTDHSQPSMFYHLPRP